MRLTRRFTIREHQDSTFCKSHHDFFGAPDFEKLRTSMIVSHRVPFKTQTPRFHRVATQYPAPIQRKYLTQQFNIVGNGCVVILETGPGQPEISEDLYYAPCVRHRIPRSLQRLVLYICFYYLYYILTSDLARGFLNTNSTWPIAAVQMPGIKPYQLYDRRRPCFAWFIVRFQSTDGLTCFNVRFRDRQTSYQHVSENLR
jgi:hypothetical protein